jgi:outer membrane protein TolC
VSKNVLTPAAAGLAIALAATPALAQSKQTDATMDAAHVHALVQQALQQVQPMPQSPTAAQAPFVTPGPRVDLSIDDAVQRALDKNIDIAVARITPRLTDFTVAGLEANYHVNLTAATNSQRSTRFPTQTFQGISNAAPTYSEGWSSGFAKNMWRGGGNWNISFTNNRQNSPASNSVRNPTFTSGLSAQYTQPLLRGFKIDATRAALRTNRISQSNDEISLQATTYTTQANVRNAYWDLVYAIQAVEAAQNSLDLANRLVRDNQSRVEIGTLAPIDVVSAQSEAANRRQALVQAEATVRTSELALKRLIVSGTDDPLWTSSINPVDRPNTTAEPIDLEAAVTRALQQRTDLHQSMNNLKISDINLRQQVDQTRPQLNLTATYGLNGIGGTQFIRGASGDVTDTIASGYLEALRSAGRFDAPQWNVSLNFAYPLGISAQESNVARSKLQIEQSQAQLKALQLQVATDVTSAALTVQSDLETVQASGVARELAQQKLDAAMSKAEVGMATNYEVVQAQRDFADAQNAELRAILNYRKALVDFDASQTVGTRAINGGNIGGGAGTGATGAGTTGTGTTGTGTGGTGSSGAGGGTGGTGGQGGFGGGL